MNRKKTFDLDDFIGEEVAGKIDADAKISRFAEIKVSAIDPRIRKEVEERLMKIKTNLNKLKKI